MMKKKMTDQKKAQLRFKQTGQEMRVIFSPQCTECKYNINLNDCKKYKPKPGEYMENQKDCPEFIQRTD